MSARRIEIFFGAGLLFLWSSVSYADRWGEFSKGGCISFGKRQHSAVLWDIPFGQSWEDHCRRMAATINGHAFSAPARCVNTRINIWGEFDVPDDTCLPHWGSFKSECKKINLRKYSSVLWELPPNTSWEAACSSMPADVNGHHFDRPTRCVNAGGMNMWGEFEVEDQQCKPRWGEFRATCSLEKDRTMVFTAVLWDVPTEEDWEEQCKNTKAKIGNGPARAPTRCEKDFLMFAGISIHGDFEVDDPKCSKATPPPLPKATEPCPPGVGDSTEQGGYLRLVNRDWTAIEMDIRVGKNDDCGSNKCWGRRSLNRGDAIVVHAPNQVVCVRRPNDPDINDDTGWTAWTRFTLFEDAKESRAN